MKIQYDTLLLPDVETNDDGKLRKFLILFRSRKTENFLGSVFIEINLLCKIGCFKLI